VFTRTIRNNASIHILAALKPVVDAVPFAVTGLDFDNGSEFLNQYVIGWAGDLTSISPGHGPTRRTIKPPSSPRTTTWSASTASTRGPGSVVETAAGLNELSWAVSRRFGRALTSGCFMTRV